MIGLKRAEDSRWAPAGYWRSLSPKTQFQAAAAIVIACSMAILGEWINVRITSSYVQARAEAGALYMEGFLAPHVQELADGRTALSEANTRSIDRLLIDTELEHRVEAIRIWLRDGRIAYSTDKSLTGKKMPSKDVEDTFTGTVTSQVAYFPDEEHSGETMEFPVLEVYAPIYRTGTFEVIAAGEFYEKADRLLAALSASRYATWLIVGATTAGMMALLYIIVSGANDLIVRQQNLLHRQLESAQALSVQNGKLRHAADLARMNASKSNETLLNSIGADIHDGPVQLLSALLLKPHDVDLVQQLARQVLYELREISGGLVLPELEPLPLKAVLQLAVHRHRNTTGTEVGECYGILPDTVAHTLKICLYRVVQEALNNATRHGRGQVQHVEAIMNGHNITVAVSDGGPGLNGEVTSAPPRKQLGLDGIRNRVAAMGGSLEIQSGMGKGIILAATVPLDRTVPELPDEVLS